MTDEDRTKEQLIAEMVKLRRRIAELEEPEGQSEQLEESRIVRIGEILMEMLFLTRSQLENALVGQSKADRLGRKHERLGEILVESGTIAEEELRLAIREQIRRRGRPSEDLYNILVVDDEVNNVAALERLLMPEYNVLSATGSEEALAMMEQNDIALMIADYRMPGMTGVELLEKVLQKYPNTIGLILTAYTDEKRFLDSISAIQAHGFVTKPWDPQEVKFTVRKWMEVYETFEKLKDGAGQSESLQGQLEEARQIVTQLTQQLEESQRLLEYHQKSWYQRWFGKSSRKGEEVKR